MILPLVFSVILVALVKLAQKPSMEKLFETPKFLGGRTVSSLVKTGAMMSK